MSESTARIRRFVRTLLRAGHARRAEDRSYFIDCGLAPVVLGESDVRALASKGLVQFAGSDCMPTAAARSWLRREHSASDAFASQHRVIETGSDGIMRDLARDPIAKLAHATGDGFLQPHHLEAGRRVVRWGERAQLRQRVTRSYDPAQVGGRRHGGSGDIADMAAEARKSLARLYADLPRDCAEILIDVCVFEKGLQTIEAERGWPRRSAKLVLKIALEALAVQVGLMPHAEGHESGRMRAAIGADFAPTRFEEIR